MRAATNLLLPSSLGFRNICGLTLSCILKQQNFMNLVYNVNNKKKNYNIEKGPNVQKSTHIIHFHVATIKQYLCCRI